MRAARIAASMLLLAGFQASPAGAGSSPATDLQPKAVEEAVLTAVAEDQRTQKEVEKFALERATLLQEISELKSRKRWLDHQVKRFSGYVGRQEETLAELARKQAELEKINRDLEPCLDEIVARLEAFIDQDLAFLDQERAGRTAFLRRSLNDYHLPLSEKLRRVMEALRVEAEYGRGVEATEEIIQSEGRPVRAEVLRLGRLALYFQTPDGRRLGWRIKGDQDWRPLDQSFRRELIKGLEMARRQRAVELLDLPVGRPQE